LAGAHHITIDQFLQNRSNFERVGKLAIAATLLPFERDSIFPMLKPWKTHPDVTRQVAEGWYGYFAKQLNLSASGWGRGLLTIVTYNYDRSLEHYLFTILKSTCDKISRGMLENFQRHSDCPCLRRTRTIPTFW